jgi:ligand-binding SRPBCC domain-containing protein
MHVLERRQRVDRPLAEVFALYADARNLARITPSWLGFRIVGYAPPGAGQRARAGGAGVGDSGRSGTETEAPTMRTGLRIEYRVRPLGFPQRWVSEITVWEPPRRFVDEQVTGPYRRWRHEHGFVAVEGGTEITDRVEYELPFGPLGRVVERWLVARQLRAIFDHRTRVVQEILG